MNDLLDDTQNKNLIYSICVEIFLILWYKILKEYKTTKVNIGGIQMLMDNMIAYAEIDEILNLLEDKYREKVPEKVRTFFKEEKMVDYKPTIDVNTPLIQQNLKRETIVLLAILNINYWCENEEEKQFFLNELAKNEEEKKRLEEKYNPDNLFKNKNNNDVSPDKIVEPQNISMVEYKKQGIFKRILDKITRFFKKN